MAQKIQRIPREPDSGRREADRARLLERVAAGLAHEAHTPLNTMGPHVQLMGEGAQMEKHLSALRDGIGRVDALLKAFGEFAQPEHLPPDLVAAVARSLQLFAYDARRASVQTSLKG